MLRIELERSPVPFQCGVKVACLLHLHAFVVELCRLYRGLRRQASLAQQLRDPGFHALGFLTLPICAQSHLQVVECGPVVWIQTTGPHSTTCKWLCAQMGR